MVGGAVTKISIDVTVNARDPGIEMPAAFATCHCGREWRQGVVAGSAARGIAVAKLEALLQQAVSSSLAYAVQRHRSSGGANPPRPTGCSSR